MKVCLHLKPLENRDLILLGQALGLLRSNLKKMKDLPEDMIDAWLNRTDHVLETSGEPTWKSLCDALKEIGQIGIVTDIQSQNNES